MKKKILKQCLLVMNEKDIKLTKINIQKLIYFLRETGIPATYKYAPYIYGPYSAELKSDLDDLAMWGDISLIENEYRIVKLEKEEDSFLPEISNKIKNLKNALDSDFSFETMEISGTLIYCYKSLKKAQENTDNENIFNEFKSWKGDKYKDSKITDIFSKIQPLIKDY